MIYTEDRVVNEVRNTPELFALYQEGQIPKAYYHNRNNVKAIILGADPSNKSDNGKPKPIPTVFYINCGDDRYFNGILSNMKCLGIVQEELYVQNVVRNYMTCETAKNKLWKAFAGKWIPLLKQDLNEIDPAKILPVFATAQIIIEALLRDNIKLIKPKIYYNECRYHTPEENILERKLIPCYRHYKYSYSNYQKYVNVIKSNL